MPVCLDNYSSTQFPRGEIQPDGGRRKIFISAWIAFLSLALVLFLTSEIVVSNITWVGMNHFAAHMHRLCDALLLALPFLLIPKRAFAIPWLIVTNVYFLANIWYYRNFGTFIPATQLLRFSDLNGLGNSITASMRWRDVWVPLPSLLWCVGLCMVQVKQRWGSTLVALAATLAFGAMEVVPSFARHGADEERHPKQMFAHQFARAYKKYGLTEYWVAQAMLYQRCSEAEMKELEAWMLSRRQQVPYVPNAAGKNLIVIVVESLSSWEVGLEVNGAAVTPRLDALIADPATVYMPNCMTQVALGRSSDCHLMLETGMLPMAGMATSLVCPTNAYYSLPKALKEQGYHSTAYVCDNKKTTWLQGSNYQAYGFDRVVDRLGVTKQSVKWDTCDQYLFPRVFQRLKESQEPFYSHVVTLSMHDSKPLPGHEGAFSEAACPSRELRNFIVRTHYTDSLIGNFIDSLKAIGLFERSVIAIVGDHYKYLASEWYGTERKEENDGCVPFILLNAPSRPADQQVLFGQIDIYPTLLDLMGVGDYPWRGFGTSLFDPIRREMREEDWRMSDILLRSDYFRFHPLGERGHIAHAGGSVEGFTYTNSMEAVEQAIALGYKYIEIDFQLSSDSILVASHDEVECTHQQFMSRLIQGRLHPLDAQMVDSIFANHPHLVLVTDKVDDIRLLSCQLPHLRGRMMVECFSNRAYDEVRRSGFAIPMRSGVNCLLHSQNAVDIDFVVYSYSVYQKIRTNPSLWRTYQKMNAQAAIFGVSTCAEADSIMLADPTVSFVYIDELAIAETESR